MESQVQVLCRAVESVNNDDAAETGCWFTRNRIFRSNSNNWLQLRACYRDTLKQKLKLELEFINLHVRTISLSKGEILNQNITAKQWIWQIHAVPWKYLAIFIFIKVEQLFYSRQQIRKCTTCKRSKQASGQKRLSSKRIATNNQKLCTSR